MFVCWLVGWLVCFPGNVWWKQNLFLHQKQTVRPTHRKANLAAAQVPCFFASRNVAVKRLLPQTKMMISNSLISTPNSRFSTMAEATREILRNETPQRSWFSEEAAQ